MKLWLREYEIKRIIQTNVFQRRWKLKDKMHDMLFLISLFQMGQLRTFNYVCPVIVRSLAVLILCLLRSESHLMGRSVLKPFVSVCSVFDVLIPASTSLITSISHNVLTFLFLQYWAGGLISSLRYVRKSSDVSSWPHVIFNIIVELLVVSPTILLSSLTGIRRE